jgi:hypothetical protein
MRFLIVFFIALLAAGCNTSPSNKVKSNNNKSQVAVNDTVPVMTFDKVEHDFGTISEGDVVETTFTFTNTGSRDLLILNARGSCGCTVPDYPKNTPIAPGDSADVQVKFDSNNKPNNNNRTVTFTTNTANGREVIRIKTFVTPDPAKEKQREERRQAMLARQNQNK